MRVINFPVDSISSARNGRRGVVKGVNRRQESWRAWIGGEESWRAWIGDEETWRAWIGSEETWNGGEETWNSVKRRRGGSCTVRRMREQGRRMRERKLYSGNNVHLGNKLNNIYTFLHRWKQRTDVRVWAFAVFTSMETRLDCCTPKFSLSFYQDFPSQGSLNSRQD